jgi:murein L,D-transpeptidase YcbB/YkuD
MTAIAASSLSPARPRLRLGRWWPSASAVVPALPAQHLQARLVAHGELAPDALSARLDDETIRAVARFQARHDLAIDGIPGPRTCDALLAATWT